MDFDSRQHLREALAHVSQFGVTYFQLPAQLRRVFSANIGRAGEMDRAIAVECGVDGSARVVVVGSRARSATQYCLPIEIDSQRHYSLIFHRQLTQTSK